MGLNRSIPYLLSLLILSGFPVATHAQPTCEQLFLTGVPSKVASDLSEKAVKNLKKYDQLFTTTRGISEYRKAFGESFSNSLKRLIEKGGHWIDSGGGEGFAIRNFLSSADGKNIHASLISLETSAGPQENLKIFKGRFLENIPTNEFEKADLITDLFGPLAYSSSPDLVLQKYFDLIKEDGEIYLFLGAQHEIFGQTNYIMTADGRRLNLSDWIKQIPGIESDLVVVRRDDDGHTSEKWTLKLTRKKGAQVQIPKVEMIHLKEGAPPKMTFAEIRQGDVSEVENIQSLREQVKAAVRKVTSQLSFAQFLGSFRSGEATHPLLASIKSLGQDSLWVNMSDVHFDVKQSLQEKKYIEERSDIFHTWSQTWIRWRTSRIQSNQLQYSKIESANDLKDLQGIKLITDLNGEFMTNLTPDATLMKYLNATSLGGEIYIYLGKENTGYGLNTKIIAKDGTRKSMRRWLLSLPDVKVKFYRGGYSWAGGEWTFIRITKKTNTFKIPQVKFLGVSLDESSEAPVMTFQEL